MHFFFPGMKQEIENCVTRCETCRKNKITEWKTKLPFLITDTPEVICKVAVWTFNSDAGK